MSHYPSVGTTAWRTWLTKILRFRPAQCWAIEGLIALSIDQGTPGALELLDDQIASWLERSLDQWRNLRDLMLQRGVLRFLPLPDAPGRYELSARLFPDPSLPLLDAPPVFTSEDRQRSFDALPDDAAPASLDGPMTEQERRWKCRLNEQVEAKWMREMTREEGQEWLHDVRRWVLAGNAGPDFVWNEFRTGGVLVTKNGVTSGQNRDVTSSVVVDSLGEESMENHNNTAEQGGSSRHGDQNQNVTNPNGSLVTEDELLALRNALAGKRVTWSVVVKRLIPEQGYAICLKQAQWLPYRDADEPGRVYHDSVMGDWEMPQKFADAEERRQKDEEATRRREEQKKQQQETARLAALRAEELKLFEENLTDDDHADIDAEARKRLPKALAEKLAVYEEKQQTVSVPIRENLTENRRSVVNERFEAWQKAQAEDAAAVLASVFPDGAAEGKPNVS